MINESIQQYGFSLFLIHQVNQVKAGNECVFSRFIEEEIGNPEQKIAVVAFMSDYSTQLQTTAAQDILKAGIVDELDNYVNSQEFIDYNKVHFEATAQFLSSMIKHGMERIDPRSFH